MSHFTQRLCFDKHFSLQRWLCNRQMRYEGGFQGRTNKLVDGCYSFWQAGAFPLIHKILMSQEDKAIQQEHFMFDQSELNMSNM